MASAEGKDIATNYFTDCSCTVLTMNMEYSDEDLRITEYLPI